MTKIIIYDFDGVLVNSRQAVYKYYDAVFKHFNLPCVDWASSELGKKAFGMTHVQLLSLYAEGEELRQMCEYVPHFTFEEMIDATPPEKGALEMIPELSDKYSLAICTNRGMSVSDYLEHYEIDNCFPCIITAADVSEAKPSPEGVNKILSFYGVKPHEALYLGDSEVDWFAAKDAGVRFLAFGESLHGSDVINDHRDIYKYL